MGRDANVGTTRAHSFSSCNQACVGSQTTQPRGSVGQPGMKTEKLSVKRHQVKSEASMSRSGWPLWPKPTGRWLHCLHLPHGEAAYAGGSRTLPGLRTVPAALSQSVALSGRLWWALFKSLLSTFRSAQARVRDMLAPGFNTFYFVGFGTINLQWLCIPWLLEFSPESSIICLISEPHYLVGNLFPGLAPWCCQPPWAWYPALGSALPPANTRPRAGVLALAIRSLLGCPGLLQFVLSIS